MVNVASFLIGIFLTLFYALSVMAESVDSLRSQINDGNDQLKVLDEEIAKYKKELNKVGGEKTTLQNTLRKLETERKKVMADIAYTEKRIAVTDLEITELSQNILEKERDIATQEHAIAEIIRRMYEHDTTSPVVVFLQYDNLGEFWRSFDDLMIVREDMQRAAENLVFARKELDEQRLVAHTKRDNFIALNDEFKDQQQVLSNTTSEKNALLKETKNKESEYQRILREKQEAKAKIEAEVRAYESRLQFILDPSSVPAPGTPVLLWPIQKPIVTQYFGGTEFAKQNASVYAGRPYHPGIDIGTPRGTKVYAAYDGVVRATGNTDTAVGCWAWGKWTLIDHPNGLATLYAHQDVISVSPGQNVGKGGIVGYSGNTGYSTGPHLHLTVYAKSAVSVKTFGATACASVPRPTAPSAAYLDPMLYLPAL